MARIFKADNREFRTTIHGASELELGMVARLNAMISSPNSGHSGTFRGGDGGTISGHFTGWQPPQQNFRAPSLLQSLGSIRGYRTNGSQGLPNSQAPSGVANPLLNLLLTGPLA